MKWKLVEAPDDDESALTADELIGVSVTVNLATSSDYASCSDTASRRGWRKLQPAVDVAFGREERP